MTGRDQDDFSYHSREDFGEEFARELPEFSRDPAADNTKILEHFNDDTFEPSVTAADLEARGAAWKIDWKEPLSDPLNHPREIRALAFAQQISEGYTESMREVALTAAAAQMDGEYPPNRRLLDHMLKDGGILAGHSVIEQLQYPPDPATLETAASFAEKSGDNWDQHIAKLSDSAQVAIEYASTKLAEGILAGDESTIAYARATMAKTEHAFHEALAGNTEHNLPETASLYAPQWQPGAMQAEGLAADRRQAVLEGAAFFSAGDAGLAQEAAEHLAAHNAATDAQAALEQILAALPEPAMQEHPSTTALRYMAAGGFAEADSVLITAAAAGLASGSEEDAAAAYGLMAEAQDQIFAVSYATTATGTHPAMAGTDYPTAAPAVTAIENGASAEEATQAISRLEADLREAAASAENNWLAQQTMTAISQALHSAQQEYTAFAHGGYQNDGLLPTLPDWTASLIEESAMLAPLANAGIVSTMADQARQDPNFQTHLASRMRAAGL